jgi:hypothetical protein
MASLVPDSVTAVREAFISSGTVLNLLSGKKPACGGRAWTPSGASSLSMSSSWALVRPAMKSGPRSCAGLAPGFSNGEGGRVASWIAEPTVPSWSNSRRRKALCSSPKMKSFVSSTPIWRELSSK